MTKANDVERIDFDPLNDAVREAFYMSGIAASLMDHASVNDPDCIARLVFLVYEIERRVRAIREECDKIQGVTKRPKIAA